MRYLMIEDETLACEELQRLVRLLRPEYELAGRAGSVQEAVELLRAGCYDLMFMDIRLSDGLSFDIFRIMPNHIPVIFTTAYDEYALRAFKANSVDYLLKPVSEEELAAALEKFEANRQTANPTPAVQRAENDYLLHCRRTRFLVTLGDEYRYVTTADIRAFMAEEKYTYLYTRGGKHYIVPYSLDSLEQMLDPKEFCRISRNCIAHIDAIVRCSKYFGGRLSIRLSQDCPGEPLIVSRGRVMQVLAWMDGAVAEGT
ncbi:MAG: response regulator transcription factor [Bacteroidaceae bacterium]|nr:response regulator transcription factor [Bacteroidaceae bacterium]